MSLAKPLPINPDYDTSVGVNYHFARQCTNEVGGPVREAQTRIMPDFIPTSSDVLALNVDPGTSEIDTRQLLSSVIVNQQTQLALQSKVPQNTQAQIQKTIEQITNSVVINRGSITWLATPVTLVSAAGSGSASVAAYVPKTAATVLLEVEIIGAVTSCLVRQNGSTGWLTLAATGTGDKEAANQGWCPIDTNSLTFQYNISGSPCYIKLLAWVGEIGTGGGSTIIGATSLSGLSDVNISGLADAQLLIYNGGSLKWTNESMVGDGSITDLGLLTLSGTGVTPGTYGNPTNVGQFIADSKGRIAFAQNVPIAVTVSGSSFGPQSANLVFAGPTTGAAANPTFRALVTADFPNSGVTAGNYGSASSYPNLTVDATGRLTAASNVPFSIVVSGTSFGPQSANTFLVAPANSAGTPTFRVMAPRDIAASPLQGTIPYATSATGLAWLGTGTANQILTTGGASANPSYQNIASLLTQGTGIAISGTTNATIALTAHTNLPAAGTLGRLIYDNGTDWTAASRVTDGQLIFGSSGVPSGSSNLFWDNTNSRLGIGTSSPSYSLQVAYTVAGSGSSAIGTQIAATTTASGAGPIINVNAPATASHTSGTVGSIASYYATRNSSGNGGTTTNSYGIFARGDAAIGATVTNSIGVYVQDGQGAGTITTQYGYYCEGLSKGGTNWAFYSAGTTASQFGGVLQTGGYKSSDGSAGITATITTAKLTAGGANGSMTFKNGILTAQTAAT